MGTNFYLHRGHRYDFERGLYVRYVPGAPQPDGEDMSPAIHVGKRSAAGPYCWDCDVTLCRGGKAGIHYSAQEWHDKCPICKKEALKKDTQNFSEGPVAVELGFAKPATERPTGVRGCSSFSWAQHQDSFRVFADEHAEERVIINEYGDISTAAEFMAMLKANCPIHYTKLIGQHFS